MPDGQTWWMQELHYLEKRLLETQEHLRAAADDGAQFGAQMAALLRRVPKQKQLGLREGGITDEDVGQLDCCTRKNGGRGEGGLVVQQHGSKDALPEHSSVTLSTISTIVSLYLASHVATRTMELLPL
uniref:Uncharacterized protein n=1 Tax=Knipowitschia caucasica TaxID=637954 RepID=A0AAV2IU81_KNICA